MTSNLDLIIKSLQTELRTRGIEIEENTEKPKMNNYVQDITEKPQIIKDLNGENLQKSQIRKRNEERQIKEYIDNSIYNIFTPLKNELKSSLDNIKYKMNHFEKELLKINLMNDNMRNFTSQLSKLENDFKLLYKNFSTSNSITIENKANIENIEKNIKTNINDTNKNIFQLKDDMNKIINVQKNLENKFNFDDFNNNNINNEKKLIDKINNLYKEKENNLAILSNNLFTKVNEFSIQSDNKIELLINSMNEIKMKLNSADNNVYLLNELPNVKELTMNNNKEIESLKSKMETISNAADLKNCKEDMEMTKNDIQIIKTDIEGINKLKNENKNLNIEIINMKNNIKLFEKKIDTIETNFFNLDGQINDNKREILQIKKEKNESKAKDNRVSVNDDYVINEKINKLNNILSENNKTISDLETYLKSKLKEQSKVYNENFHNINKKMETFNNEEIKLNEENSKLMGILGKKIIDNNDMIKNIIESDLNTIFEKFEIINRNFKAMNKYHNKINELDKIIKEKLTQTET